LVFFSHAHFARDYLVRHSAEIYPWRHHQNLPGGCSVAFGMEAVTEASPLGN